MISIIGFNAQLQPEADLPLRSVTLRERSSVLLADGLALNLVGLWLAEAGRL